MPTLAADLDVLVVDDDLDALAVAEDDHDQEGEAYDLLEVPPSCTCTCGPAAHLEAGCAPPCLCPAPGLRGLLDDEPDELEEDVALVIKSAAARRRRQDDQRGKIRAAMPQVRSGVRKKQAKPAE